MEVDVDRRTLKLQQEQQHQQHSDKMTQCINTGSRINSVLDLQKFSRESEQQDHTNAGGAAGGGGIGNGGVSAGNGGHAAHEEYKGPELWRYLVKQWPQFSQPLALLVIFIGLWCIGYVLLPTYTEPQTVIMRIILLFVGAQIAGMLVTLVKLPDMLGMLFFGVLYTNVGLADFSGYDILEVFLREMALVNIMLLAGLGLDWNAFKKLWLMILRLTLIPTIAEVMIISILARFLLGMPWVWGILLGLVVTAVSPNVVVTIMLHLKQERLGLNNGIHTLIYAMTVCNDVFAIFMFGVILGGVYTTGNLTEQILQGPIGIGIGIVYGYVYGLLLQYLPSKKSNYANGLRFVLIVLGGAISVMCSRAIGYPSAGALGCVTLAFIGGMGWKRQEKKLTLKELHTNESSSVPRRLDLLWKFLKPVSFGLIGKEINFAVLDGRVVGYGALLVLLGSLFRLGFAYISTYGGNLTRKERAYITISGFPKATVQAALAPVALYLARSFNASEEDILYASNILIISVLAIIFTAPLGAILMLRLAPLWLQRSSRRGSTIDDNTNSNRNRNENDNVIQNENENDNENGRRHSVPNNVNGYYNKNCIGINIGGDDFGLNMMNSSKFIHLHNLSQRSSKSPKTMDIAAVSDGDSTPAVVCETPTPTATPPPPAVVLAPKKPNVGTSASAPSLSAITNDAHKRAPHNLV